MLAAGLAAGDSLSVSVTVTITSAGPAVSVLPTSSPASRLLTSEGGAGTLALVRLSEAPTADVVITVASSAPDEVLPSVASLTFTPANWSIPQAILLAGVDDAVVDGPQDVTITLGVIGGTSQYLGLNPADVHVRNLDDETPLLVLAETGGSTVVAESGSTDTVLVSLGAEPAGDVTVTLQGGAQVQALPPSLVFTPADWNVAVPVTLAAVDDALAQGSRSVLVTASASGGGYDGATPVSVLTTILDDDAAVIEVTPTAGLLTDENGRQAVFGIRLGSRPSADVTIPLTSSAVAEGTVLPASLTFTSGNWSTYQSVTITGVADSVVDGDQSYSIVTAAAASADPAYAGLNAANVAVVNLDMDAAAIVASPMSATVDESGGSATVQVRLATRPLAPVTITVASANLLEATALPATLTFDDTDWDQPQDLVITGVDDALQDGNQLVTVSLTASGDAAYAALAPVNVQVVNQDDEIAMLLISQTGALSLSEALPATVSYGLRLSKAPASDVTVTVQPDAQLSLVTPATVVFTAADWMNVQTVTIAAVDDDVAEGAHQGQVQHVLSSADGAYDGLSTQVATAAITDNDTPDIVASATTGLETTEIGGTDTVTVRLGSRPTAAVRIPLASSDPGQGAVSPAELVIQPDDWNLDHVVTLTGTDGNAFHDGDVPWQVALGPAISADPFYHGRLGPTLQAVNRAVDHAPTLAPLANLTVAEDAPPQVVALLGISAGQAGEVQVVTVTAASSDEAISGTPVVSYTSPSSSGSLVLTPPAEVAGAALITVTVSDGVSTTQRSFTFTVDAVNDPPVIVRNTQLSVGYRGTAAYIGLDADPLAPGQLAADDAETAAAALVYHIALPTAGTLARLGAPLGIGDTFTQADVDLGRITYTHEGAAGTADGFVVTVEDGDGGTTIPTVVVIDIDRTAPAIDLLPGATPVFTEDQAPVAIAAAAVVVDDGPDYTGGELRVAHLAGGRSGDVLSLRHDGFAAGQIGVSGSDVLYGGVVIGILEDGAWPTALVVRLNGNADDASVQAALRAVLFRHDGDDPGSADRILGVSATDGVGDASPVLSRTVQVVPVNDPPVASDLTLACPAGATVTGTIVVSDPDGAPAAFAIGTAPARGTLLALGAGDGTFRYQADAGVDGSDSFTVTVDDGAASVTVTVTVLLTGPASAERLWIISDPPLEVQEGAALSCLVRLDLSGLSGAPDLRFQLVDAPAGMSLAVDLIGGTATIVWPVAAPGADRHLRFSVLVWDANTGASDILPVSLFVHPAPGGGG